MPLRVYSSRPSAFAKEGGAALTKDDVARALEAIDLDFPGMSNPAPPEGASEGAKAGDAATPDPRDSGSLPMDGALESAAPASEAPPTEETGGLAAALDEGGEGTAEPGPEALRARAALRYRGPLPSGREWSLDIGEDERVAVVGANEEVGSLAFQVLSALVLPSGHELTLSSHGLHELSTDERTEIRSRLIGVVSATIPLLASLTLRENLALPLALGRGEPAEGKDLEALAHRLDFGAVLDRYPEECDPALCPLAQLARALVRDPAIVLVDLASFGELATPLAQAVPHVLPSGRAAVVFCAPGHAPGWVSREVRIGEEAA